MLEVVVTEASLPERMGAKTERRGSLLWRTDWTYFVSILLLSVLCSPANIHLGRPGLQRCCPCGQHSA